MKKLTEGDVERLLKGAADWEPTAPPPPMALPESRRRRVAPTFRVAGLSSLAVAVVAVGWQLAPRPAPGPATPSVAAVEQAPTQEPPEASPAPVRLASEPIAPKRPPRVVRSDDGENEPVRRRPRRKRNWIGARKTETDRAEYAPYRYVLSSQPLPKDAITLEDAPHVVPVVLTDRDAKTGDLRLVPAAAVVSDSPESAYSLE